MELTEIKREPKPEIDDRASMALAASDVLRYNVLRQELENGGHPSKLRTILAELEVELLDPSSVEKYQIEKQRNVAKEKFEQWLEDCSLSTPSLFHCPYWKKTAIEDYSEAIPIFVLSKLIQVRQRCPEVTLSIVHLIDDLDPFAVAEIPDRTRVGKGELYWLEVWSEPAFERAQ